MNYLLDTNVVIAILRGRPPEVFKRLESALQKGASIGVSSIVLFELWYGIKRSERPSKNIELLRFFMSGNISVLPFNEEDAKTAGELKARLEHTGLPIGPYDLLIAAQALSNGKTLVTANVSEFARVPGLNWEDWSAENLE